jgi:hypothetical protein
MQEYRSSARYGCRKSKSPRTTSVFAIGLPLAWFNSGCYPAKSGRLSSRFRGTRTNQSNPGVRSFAPKVGVESRHLFGESNRGQAQPLLRRGWLAHWLRQTVTRRHRHRGWLAHWLRRTVTRRVRRRGWLAHWLRQTVTRRVRRRRSLAHWLRQTVTRRVRRRRSLAHWLRQTVTR